MNTARHRLVPAVAAGGLALATAATALISGSPATAGVPSHNEQVALVDGTGAQLEFKSKINGTAQVTSYDGRYVVFSTDAPLVASDDNGIDDVYRRDTVNDVTLLVSAAGGQPGNDYSVEPSISDTGRFVAFTTWATDLTQDRNGSTLDVVVKDLRTDRIRLVSVTSKEKQVRQNSFSPVISGNGRHVSFQTFGRFGRKDGDKLEDVYVRDVRRGVTRQASLHPTGNDIRESVLNGDISDNGRIVVFGNDNRLWARNVARGTTVRFWQEPDAPPCQPFPAGSAGRPVISGDGRFVAFASCATDLPGENGQATDVYRMRLSNGAVQRVTKKGNGNSYLASLSRNGRYVGFGSDATNFVAGDTSGPDAFVADVRTGAVTRASQTPGGSEGNNWSAANAVAISGDGRSLAYQSYASDLVPGDTVDLEEVFVWRR
jgi:Tol biopolymer transport system component